MDIITDDVSGEAVSLRLLLLALLALLGDFARVVLGCTAQAADGHCKEGVNVVI